MGAWSEKGWEPLV